MSPYRLPIFPVKAFVICCVACLAALVTAFPASAAEPGNDTRAAADHLIRLSGITRGICCVLGGENSGIALELAGMEGFYVNLIDPRHAAVAGVRKEADGKGLYGRSLVALQGSFKRLPYADNTVDLVVSAHLAGSELEELSPEELLRVLRPRGAAVVGSLRGGRDGLTKAHLGAWLRESGECQCRSMEDELGAWAVLDCPPLAGADNWSHWEHGPDNNPVSHDTAIRAPYMTQFLGLPYYIAMPAITTVAGGRIFTAMGHIAHHKREEPWLNTLIARNGYNGTELWRRMLPDGYLVHRSAFIATDSTFYMITPEGDGCLMLEPGTGAEKGRVRLAQVEGEWKWIALEDGVLFILAGKQKDP
ncbi:MAG: methyltransferase domain-containing protein, partial [Candidatus Glassbacteria bacterium]|nr:methyltransferase domain-containing protein [Candidatus Glassbacteria bacterium]